MNETSATTSERLVPISQAARYIGVSRSTINYWIRRGYVDVHRLEGLPYRRVDLDEVVTFAVSRERSVPTSNPRVKTLAAGVITTELERWG